MLKTGTNDDVFPLNEADFSDPTADICSCFMQKLASVWYIFLKTIFYVILHQVNVSCFQNFYIFVLENDKNAVVLHQLHDRCVRSRERFNMSYMILVCLVLILISGVSNHRVTHHEDTDCMTRSLTSQTLMKYAQSSVCVTITNGAPCFVPNLVFFYVFAFCFVHWASGAGVSLRSSRFCHPAFGLTIFWPFILIRGK